MIPRLSLLTGLFLITFAARAATLQVQDAHVPEGPPVAPVLAGYLTLVNPGEKTVRIVGASSDQFEAVEIHEMRMKDGVMTMKPVPALAIPAGGKVSLAPGGLHLMLIRPRKAFRAGDTIRVTLKLDDGSTLAARLPVKGDDDHAHHRH